MIKAFILQITQPGASAADTVFNAANSLTQPAEQSISLWDMAEKGGPILIPIAICETPMGNRYPYQIIEMQKDSL